MSRDDFDDPAGHYRSAGYAIAGMGGLAAALYLTTTLADVELGFITQNGIFAICLLNVGIGWSMVLYAEATGMPQ